MMTPADRSCRTSQGFTLAELIVATTLLTIVMTSVYVMFGSTLRAWRLSETEEHSFQDARYAMSVFSRELNSVLGGTEHLFEGDRDELEFITVGIPMDVGKNEGARVLWVRYHFDRTNHALVRQEAVIKSALPPAPAPGTRFDRGRIKKGRSHKFTLASDVRDFELRYKWVKPPQLKKDQVPEWVFPITLKQNELGWGLPQGVTFLLTVDDSTSESKRSTFEDAVTFRGPTTPYDETRLQETGREAS